MKTAMAWLGRRLSGRPDSEHGQALIRLALLFVVLVFLLWTDRSLSLIHISEPTRPY